MTSLRHKMYLRRMFEGENGDFVKNLLTDGQWKPRDVGGADYGKDEKAPLAFKIILTIFLVGAVGFGVWKFLVWIW